MDHLAGEQGLQLLQVTDPALDEQVDPGPVTWTGHLDRPDVTAEPSSRFSRRCCGRWRSGCHTPSPGTRSTGIPAPRRWGCRSTSGASVLLRQ